MKLKNLFLKLKDNKLQSLKLKGLSYDSRRVAEGDLFFIIKRKNFDIFSVLSLVEKKAAAFVGEFKDKKKISSLIKQKPLILVKDIEKELYRVSNIFYQINTKALNLSFDITPSKYVKSIITEKGIARPPYKKSIKELFQHV